MAVGRINSVQSAGRIGPAPVVGKINAAHVIGVLGGLALLAGAAHGASQAYQGYKDQQAFKMDQEVASGKRPNPFVEASEARKTFKEGISGPTDLRSRPDTQQYKDSMFGMKNDIALENMRNRPIQMESMDPGFGSAGDYPISQIRRR